jgi:hypothetical protein
MHQQRAACGTLRCTQRHAARRQIVHARNAMAQHEIAFVVVSDARERLKWDFVPAVDAADEVVRADHAQTTLQKLRIGQSAVLHWTRAPKKRTGDALETVVLNSRQKSPKHGQCVVKIDTIGQFPTLAEAFRLQNHLVRAKIAVRCQNYLGFSVRHAALEQPLQEPLQANALAFAVIGLLFQPFFSDRGVFRAHGRRNRVARHATSRKTGLHSAARQRECTNVPNRTLLKFTSAATHKLQIVHHPQGIYSIRYPNGHLIRCILDFIASNLEQCGFKLYKQLCIYHKMIHVPVPQPMKLEHLYNTPPPPKVLLLSSRRMRICRILARPLTEERCAPLIEAIEEHLALWREEVHLMRTQPRVLNHKKYALFAWDVQGSKLGSSCPHFDTLCFEHTLALLHLELGRWEKAQDKTQKCQNIFEYWKEPTLVGNPNHVILFPDFHAAVGMYAQAQSALDSLNVQLSTYPRVPFAHCAKMSVKVLQYLNRSMALNTHWGLNLNHSMASMASLGRGLMALDTIEYDHGEAQSLHLSRSGSWKEEHFPTVLSILQLAPESKGNVMLPSIRRAIDSNIRGFIEGVNRDVYHTRAHPNFLKVFEETIVPKYLA